MRRMLAKSIPIFRSKSSNTAPFSKLEILFPERTMNPYYTQRDEAKLMRMGIYACSVAAAAIGVIARQMTSATLKVYRERQDGTLKEERDHWLRQVISRPNGFTSEKELWYKTALHLLSAGAAFWELRRRNPGNMAEEVREIHILPPHCVKVLADDEEIKGYEYWKQDGSGKAKIDFAVQQVLRLPYPDAMDNYGHVSPLSSVFDEMLLDGEATMLVYDFIRNDAVPPLLLSVEGDIEEEDAIDIEERWWQRFGRNSKKRGRPGVIGHGTKPHQLSTNFKDMGFQEVRAHVETRICAALGVDPVLLPTWIGVSEANTHANFESARKHLWDNTIIPLLQLIESKINSQLLWNESGVVARFDLSEVDALKEKKENQWKRTTEAFKVGLLTVNQALQELGKDAIGEQGDYRIFDLQKEALMARTQTLGDIGQGQQEKGAKSAAPSPEAKELDEDSQSALIDGLLNAQREAEEDLRGRMKDFFRNQKRKVGEILQRKAISEEELSRIEAESNQTVEEDQESLAEELTLSAILALLLGGRTAGGVLGIDFVESPEIHEIVRRNAQLVADAITQATREDIAALLQRAQREGWPITRLRDEIRALFNRYIDERADLIAITEATWGINIGAALAFELAGYLRMRWEAVGDDRTCPFCRALNGRVVEIGKPFASIGDKIIGRDASGRRRMMEVGLRHVFTPPLHPRCRCVLVPVD